jgi:hypothetical protein
MRWTEHPYFKWPKFPENFKEKSCHFFKRLDSFGKSILQAMAKGEGKEENFYTKCKSI